MRSEPNPQEPRPQRVLAEMGAVVAWAARVDRIEPPCPWIGSYAGWPPRGLATMLRLQRMQTRRDGSDPAIEEALIIERIAEEPTILRRP